MGVFFGNRDDVATTFTRKDPFPPFDSKVLGRSEDEDDDDGRKEPEFQTSDFLPCTPYLKSRYGIHIDAIHVAEQRRWRMRSHADWYGSTPSAGNNTLVQVWR